ncbi:MAG: hypothetical protein H3C34_03175 [Caldilineaceae bacterium]|nr:hypothetical protein [Caldilineaceae bacterium]
MTSAPTVAEIDRIAAMDDPLIRNLQITQAYAELSAAVAQRTGPAANWCTFATWASKQAGQTIRKEDLARTLQRAVTDLLFAPAPAAGEAAAAPAAIPADVAMIQKTLWDVLDPQAPFQRASDAVARGNRKVFAEIGREFARFLATCVHDPAYDETKIEQFCSNLRPGEPPHGQRYLRQAFTRYYRAWFEDDDSRRAQLMLAANVEIGLHEQTRLQPEIAEAMAAPIVDPRELSRRLVAVLFPGQSWLDRTRRLIQRLRGAPSPLDLAVDRFVARVRHEARLIISEHMMTLSLPQKVVLRLGRDLSAEFPPELRQITDPDLRGLLDLVDPTQDSVRESGAMDWADLPERLHFIVDLFRCYQAWPPLFQPPFSPQQVAALKAGRRPGGQL